MQVIIVYSIKAFASLFLLRVSSFLCFTYRWTLDLNPSTKVLIVFKTSVSSDIQQDNSFALSLDTTTIPLIYFNMRKSFKQFFYLNTIFLSWIFVQERSYLTFILMKLSTLSLHPCKRCTSLDGEEHWSIQIFSTVSVPSVYKVDTLYSSCLSRVYCR